MDSQSVQLRVTDRISLRTRTEQDAEELFALTDANRDYLRQWLPWLDRNQRVDDTLHHIRHCLQQQQDGTGLTLAIVEDQRIIGVIGYNEIDKANRGGFIGYWLSQSHTGRGIMTMSCRALINFGFHQLNLNRQGISAAVENRASRAIPERLGFRLEGIERDAEWLYDHFVDHAFYAMLAREWKA